MELLRSVSGFFHEEVTDALRARDLELAPGTEFYLVNLLAEFTTAPVEQEPLTLKLAEAQSAVGETRTRTLKSVGDTSLYMSGFFADALARKLIDIDFYMSLGGTAYRQLAAMQSVAQLAPVYRELAGRFADLVGVFGDIRQRSHFAGGNMVKLYEEWRRTGSDVLERRLRELGMLTPMNGSDN